MQLCFSAAVSFALVIHGAPAGTAHGCFQEKYLCEWSRQAYDSAFIMDGTYPKRHATCEYQAAFPGGWTVTKKVK